MTNTHIAQRLVAGHAHELKTFADQRRRWSLARRASRDSTSRCSPLGTATSRTTEAAAERVAA